MTDMNHDELLFGNFDIIKMMKNKSKYISREEAILAICNILTEVPETEFQEGEMAGMVRARKAVKNVRGVELPEPYRGGEMT